MGLGIFNRNRKSFIAPPAPFVQPLELRVLVDAGPAARDAFTISVSPEGTVDSIREAVAAHIGRTAIALFKVSSVPCMAHLRFPASPLSLWYERQWPIDECRYDRARRAEGLKRVHSSLGTSSLARGHDGHVAGLELSGRRPNPNTPVSPRQRFRDRPTCSTQA